MVELRKAAKPRVAHIITDNVDQGETHMDCHHLMQYALLSVSEVDIEDVRLGQLLTLLVGLTLVVIVRVFLLLF
jgi:hypothetical protein